MAVFCKSSKISANKEGVMDLEENGGLIESHRKVSSNSWSFLKEGDSIDLIAPSSPVKNI